MQASINEDIAAGGLARRAGDSRMARLCAGMLRFTRKQPLGAVSAVLLVIIVLMAVGAGVVAQYSPTRNNVGERLTGPSADHWFGTDQFGRDVFSRVVYGGRISLAVGLGASAIAILVATVIGLISGYLGGWFDSVVQRLVDTAQAIPPLIMLIGIMIVLGPSVTNVILALSARGGLALSRVIRGAVIAVRSSPYIEAARAIGVSQTRIILVHVLPNIVPTIVVLVSTSIGGYIVAEASLSFLGYGVPPPDPTWGGMMSSDGRLYMLVYPGILIFPTIALALVVYAMNMLGDALRDEIDPRLRGLR